MTKPGRSHRTILWRWAIPSERHKAIIKLTFDRLLPAIKGVLSRNLKDRSEAECHTMAAVAADRACAILADDLTMASLAAAGDTSRPDGSVNVIGVVAALGRLSDSHRGLPGGPELNHLVQHVNFTLTRLHLLV